MIVSHRFRFIFIKNHKTAGSSMEMALGPLCGREDVIPPMELDDTAAFHRNFHAEKPLARAYVKSSLLRKLIDRHSPLIAPYYYEHMPATRVREIVGQEVWANYYKFCFERNPWDKVLSYYNWRKFGLHRRMPPFRDYILKRTNRLPLDGRLYFEGENLSDG